MLKPLILPYPKDMLQQEEWAVVPHLGDVATDQEGGLLRQPRQEVLVDSACVCVRTRH